MDQIIKREQDKGYLFCDCHLNYHHTNTFSYVLFREGELVLDNLNNLPSSITNGFSFLSSVLIVKEGKHYVIKPNDNNKILAIKNMTQNVSKIRSKPHKFNKKLNKQTFIYEDNNFVLQSEEYVNDPELFYYAEYILNNEKYEFHAKIDDEQPTIFNKVIHNIYEELINNRQLMVTITNRINKINNYYKPFIFYNFNDGTNMEGIISVLPLNELTSDVNVDMSFIETFNYKNNDIPLLISLYDKNKNVTAINFFSIEKITPIIIKQTQMEISNDDIYDSNTINECHFCQQQIKKINLNDIDEYKLIFLNDVNLNTLYSCETCWIYYSTGTED